MAYIKRYEDSYLDQEQEEIDELIKSATVSSNEGDAKNATLKWAKIAEMAENSGNKELYYKAIEKMESLS